MKDRQHEKMLTKYTMLTLVLLNLIVLATSLPFEGNPIIQNPGEVCGYQSCPSTDNEVLNVHLVAHTHDDVGWLKTVDQYYYGSRNGIQKAGVQYIIESVVNELWEDRTRRFIYVETAFFWKWWTRQTESMKRSVHELVRQGRLEFIGGAWSMNDEAAAHYQSTIDQFTFGLRILNDTFGECGRPKVGWQIDPFGHSKEFSSMLAQMGYDGLFLGRIDYQDKKVRMDSQTMEMVWRGDDDVGNPSDLFTGVLYNDYAAPRGFCFDILCQDEPIIDDKDSPLNNVESKVDEFLGIMNVMSTAYKHKHVLVTMGEDFHYQEAGMWFKNMDKLIFYANEKAEKEGLKVKLFYSTPSCYLKAVKDANLTLPIKQDDFFPYASDEHAYWTGYFTSRPTTKYFERLANGYLQAVKQLQVLGNLDQDNEMALHTLKDAMGVMQHHDAITGTEKQHVTHDYERILTGAVDDALTVARQTFNKILYESPPSISLNFDRCEFNQSQCYISENKNSFVLTIYNPLGWKVTAPIRVPIIDGEYSVINPEGEQLQIQIAKLSPNVLDIPTRKSKATHELIFLAEYLPALGFKQYYIKKIKNNRKSNDFNMSPDNISNQHYSLKLDTDIGITEISLPDGSEFKISCDYYMYRGYIGDNTTPANRSSGAYIFRPNGTISNALKKTIGKVTEGPIFDQIEYNYEIGSLTFTLYKHADIDDIEVIWTVRIDVEDHIGKEVVIKYKTDINNNGEFYTDASGRQMVKRRLNERPQWNVTLAEPIAGNYYPVVNKIHINDDKMRFSVITDRSQGGSSLNNGNVELMVHRRLLSDDGKGVGEALNETANGQALVARGNHYLYLLPITKEYSIREKKRTIEHHLKPQVYVSDAENLNINEWLKLKNEWSGLDTALPEGIHLLTLEPWTRDSLLLRLENYLERNDKENVITVDVAKLFNGLELIEILETNLAANQWIENFDQWSWVKENEFSSNFNEQYGKSTPNEKVRDTPRQAKVITDFNVGLGPKEFRTFIIKYQYKK